MQTAPENLVLCGFMGAGKTTIGRRAARQLGLQFVDLDTRIAARAGQSVAEIFRSRGEAHFRELEHAAACAAGEESGLVIATGGGIVLDPRNLEVLGRRGLLVCLTASEETLWERVRHNASRPLLQAPDPRARLHDLLAQRAPLYAALPHCIDTTDLSTEEAAAALASLWETVRGKENPA